MRRGSIWTLVVVAAYGILVISMFSGFIFTNKMIFGTDMIPMGYMMRKVVTDYWREYGRIPLWDPYILCGLPVVDAMHGDLFYPATLLSLLMPLHRALGYKILLHVWLAGITMYALLRSYGFRRRSSFVGGLAYMIAPYLISLTYAGHDAKMFVTSLFPLCVLTLERLIRKPTWLQGALFGGSIGLLFLTSHPQMTYFSSWGLGIYFLVRISELIRKKALFRTIGVLVLGIILGVAVGCIQILPAYHYTTNFSPRTGGVTFEYAASWSLHPEEIFSLLYPSFGGYLDSYWGRNPFKLNAESPGPLMLVLAIAGIIVALRRKELKAWVLLAIFCPLYALGAHTPVFKLLFYSLPGVKFLRAPSLIMFMFSASVAVLGAYFLDVALKEKKIGKLHGPINWILISVICLTVLSTAFRGAAFTIWQGIFGSISQQKLHAMQLAKEGLLYDGLRLGLFALPLLGVMLSKYRRRWNGSVIVVITSLGLLATSLPHSMKFLKYIDRRQVEMSHPVIEAIRQDKGIYRVLPVTSTILDTNYLPIFGIETSNGFYDNRIRYYDFLVGKNLSNLVSNPNILRMTNTKYVILSRPIDHPFLTLKKQFDQFYLYQNRGFLPRCFLVHSLKVVEDDSTALRMLSQPDFDVSREIVTVGGNPMSTDSIPPGETAVIKEYQPDRITIEAEVKKPGYLFYSGNYLPYWKATVDGNPTGVVRADISMMAIYLEPGKHLIELRYVSSWYDIGRLLFSIGCIGIVLPVLINFLRRGKRRG